MNEKEQEQLDRMEKRLKRIEINEKIQTAIVVLGFLGIVSFAVMVEKIKKSK